MTSIWIKFARMSVTALILIAVLSAPRRSSGDDRPQLGDRLNDAQVGKFADLALAGIGREYPNKPSQVMLGPESVRSPKELHPAFYGCFDWHSSVHGHWMLIRLLKLHPGCSSAEQIRRALSRHLTSENIRSETAYFDVRENQSFERMYGWAWALRLAAELHAWDDGDGRRWRASIRPLETRIVELIRGYLPRLSHPIRSGVHPDTAFALAQALDYARVVGDRDLEQLIVQRGRAYYLADRDYPAPYEPSGEDFFSAGLNEADLMRRILPKEEFSNWLDQFLPGLRDQGVARLLVPVEVTDVTDAKLVHLAGLDLARGWTLRGIASALDQEDPRAKVLHRAAESHARAGYGYVFSGHYEGEHWLATFAVYLQTGVGLDGGLAPAQHAEATRPFDDPVERQIAGWTVAVDPQLLSEENRETGSKALEALANHLQRITYILPEDRLAELRKLRIWIELDNPKLSSMQYHPNRGWLVAHGHDPRLVKHVHVPRAKALFDRKMWAKHPYVVMHELAHSYHDQVLGFDHPEILAAYKEAKEQGIYEDVLLYTGKRVRHYALRDHKEYFAESTEAYLGVNDFYPFVRAELKEHDPGMFSLMEKIWGPVP